MAKNRSSFKTPSQITLFQHAVAIIALQTYTLALYGARNNILHDGDGETAAIVNSHLNDEIHQLYRDKETFSACDRAYFSIPVE
jgi:hypothetical protein